jgi:hypothetical protein
MSERFAKLFAASCPWVVVGSIAAAGAGCTCDSSECFSGFRATVHGEGVVDASVYSVELALDDGETITCELLANASEGSCFHTGGLGIDSFIKSLADEDTGESSLDLRGQHQPVFVTVVVVRDGVEVARVDTGPLAYQTTDNCNGDCRATAISVEVPGGV